MAQDKLVERDSEIDDRHLMEQFNHAERLINWLYARKIFSYAMALLERAISDEVAANAALSAAEDEIARLKKATEPMKCNVCGDTFPPASGGLGPSYVGTTDGKAYHYGCWSRLQPQEK